MGSKDKICIVIPSLDPDEKLQKTVDGLREAGFSHFVLVDDGSHASHRKYFPKACEENGIMIRYHRQNHGKGAALRTAFKYILGNCPDIEGVITVDGDGQHAPKDVAACAEALMKNPENAVLGCRDFSLPNVPPRSRFGNRTTSLVFKVLCGMNISDTQTGLRAFPVSMLPLLMTVKGDRFEYETNMLVKFKQCKIDITEVKISTLYIEENKSSHFRTIRDSVRVYGFFLGFVASSLFSCLVDAVIFYLFCKLFTSSFGAMTITYATVVARIISSFTNFTINRHRVFNSNRHIGKTLGRYYTLAIPQMFASAGLVSLLSKLLRGSHFGNTLIKMLVDTTIFFISYRIQQGWVFAEDSGTKKKKVKKTTAKKLTLGTIIKRIFLSVGTILLAAIITLYSSLLVVARGPSKSLRNMLVLSAKQASATKWVPSLFLSQSTIKEIIENSNDIDTEIIEIDPDDDPDDSDEWDDAIDGMKLIFISQPDFKAYLLMIKDPSRVKVGVANEDFSSSKAGARIFDIADKYKAIAAINGGEFLDSGGLGNGARPMGLTYSMGKCVWSDSLSRSFFGFDKDNNLICKNSMTKAQAEELGIRDAVCFQHGNVLIEQNGSELKLYYSNDNTGKAQRTAIAQRADKTVLMLVTDGRTASSIGATRNDLIDILLSYGAVSAGMLDGGSSAMLYYRDYYNKYNIDEENLDTYQKQFLVNRYKAFTKPRRIPTFFIVTD